MTSKIGALQIAFQILTFETFGFTIRAVVKNVIQISAGQRQMLSGFLCFCPALIKAIAPNHGRYSKGRCNMIRTVTMSQSQYKSNLQNLKAGQVIAQEIRGNVEISAYIHEYKKWKPIGTISGAVYEVVKPVLEKYQWFCLSQHELKTIEEYGAQFIRIILPSKRGTFSISVQDFKLHMADHYDRRYGPQWGVPLSAFSSTSKVSKRNAIIDSPAIARPGPIAPRERQMQLFGGGHSYSPKPHGGDRGAAEGIGK